MYFNAGAHWVVFAYREIKNEGLPTFEQYLMKFFVLFFVMIASLLCSTDIGSLIQMVKWDIPVISVGQYTSTSMYFSVSGAVNYFTNYSEAIMTSNNLDFFCFHIYYSCS